MSATSTPLADLVAKKGPKDQGKKLRAAFNRHLRRAGKKSATDEDLRGFAEPYLQKVRTGYISYRTVFTYMSRATAGHRRCRQQFFKGLSKLANATDGDHKAPRCSDPVEQKVVGLLSCNEIPIMHRMGIFVQVCRGGRASDPEWVRRDGLTKKGIYWRVSKNITKSDDRKDVVIPEELNVLLPPPPMPWAEWEKIPANEFPLKGYDWRLCNRYLKKYVPTQPQITSESIRDIYHRALDRVYPGDKKKKAEFTIHRMDTKMLSAHYDAPRKNALLAEK